jgi:putative ubiquitin-RnfH superfamily antitoxin RatB of RatAB toxin-antitoxin module
MKFMVDEENPRLIQVEVAYGTPDKQRLLVLSVERGCTAGEAIEGSGIRDEFPEIDPQPVAVGIFGLKVDLGHPLRDGDRVEIYRPLIADPKEVRRQRARARPGGKAKRKA